MTSTISTEQARKRVEDFKHRWRESGDAFLYFAYHAALPVVLNPELLHLLRINFFLDQEEVLPFTAEFEFLLSSLCREIDEGLYEIEPAIRDVLLEGLTKKYDSQRIRDVATLLWQYVEQHSPWAERVELERAQQLTALNFLDPEKAQQWLKEAEAATIQSTVTEREWFVAMRQAVERITPKVQEQRLIEQQAEPSNLTGLQPLTASQRRELRKALIAAYPRRSELEMLLDEELNVNLNYIVGGSNLEEIVFELIEWAEAHGRLGELIQAAYRDNPNNIYLSSLVKSLGDGIVRGGQDEQLYQSLLKLGYVRQVRVFQKFIQSSSIAAFLIYSPPEYGQRWLLNRLLVQHTRDILTGRVIKIELSRVARRNDISALWQELSVHVGLKRQGKISDIVNRIYQWWQSQNVLLILHGVDLLPEEFLNEFLHDFWVPLMTRALEGSRTQSNYKLLMFLVDYDGYVGSWKITFAEKLDSTWQPNIPIKLPILKEFSESELLDWLEVSADALPAELLDDPNNTVRMILENSDNGVPEPALGEICRLAGSDWYEIQEKWLKL